MKLFIAKQQRCRLFILLLSIAASVPFVIGIRENVFGKDKPGMAEKILVEKSVRHLTLFRAGNALRVYRIALGAHPVGPKEREGDGKTPEGL